MKAKKVLSDTNIILYANPRSFIIRKSKRCKNFKRCVRGSKTRSTNGVTPPKEK